MVVVVCFFHRDVLDHSTDYMTDHSRPPAPAPVMSAPVIMTTPATPDGDPYIKKVKKQRSTTMPTTSASASVASFFPPQVAPKGHSRSTSLTNGSSSRPADIPPQNPILFPSATIPRQRMPLQMPPYPATPPPLTMVTGQDYISASPPSAAPIHRIPTVLRPGAGHGHDHDSHRNSGSMTSSPRDSAVEIGESREIQRTDISRVRHSSSLRHKVTIPTEEYKPSSERSPTSYRDSILSTFSHRSGSVDLSRSLSTKSTATTAVTALSPAARRPARTSSTRTENHLAILKSFDTLFLIDDSPSMLYEARWEDTAAALASISEIATKYDSDGIDILFLNSPEKDKIGVKSPEEVNEIFQTVRPLEGGSTPLGSRLDGILRGYLDRYRRAREEAAAATADAPGGFVKKLTELIKPLNVVVITDGDATDDPESVIVSVAKELDRLNAPLSQVGIQMFQVGGDSEAEEFLRGLDDVSNLPPPFRNEPG